eukprot:gnl/MRDRNA2_/MRDRNA2_73261_c0_seq2.p1 gnl/MRDRNA2_/MRDRNA2_73261_c0~~gnl/MRDRNA2_/MRDRNA2_73261_c0_seq2.p1  ORF type:complete len:182 (+),score=58.80 gnl/MRDRNA2_/MRDRNA2_73261_c0_seq2:64-546(+)
MSRIAKACSGDRMYGGGFGAMGGVDAEEVESFLSKWEIDEKAANALRELPPAAQKAIISNPMDRCTNKSSALMSRIAKAHSGDRMYGGGMGGKGGKGGKGGMKGMGDMGGMGGMGDMGGMMQMMMGNMQMMTQMMGMMGAMKGGGMGGMGGKGGGKFNPY